MVVATSSESVAHPPTEPTHGLNESEFWVLWAGDEDSANVTENSTRMPLETLTAGTDIPLDRPPRSVETWNRRDIAEMPETDIAVASHPSDTMRSNGTYLRDVGVTIGAIQPSTRVHLSEIDQPLYIAPDGEVLGAVDYRVVTPSNGTTGSDWQVKSHDVESVRLLLDGEVLDTANHTKTPTLTYGGLEPGLNETATLTLEATVTVQLRRVVATENDGCAEPTMNGLCQASSQSLGTRQESITVRDNATVTVYDLIVSGYQTEYPDGDLGLVAYKNYPWYGLDLPEGEVRGVWRFYVARKPAWDNLTTYDGTNTTTGHSPVHPLQVHAFPIETGPTPWPRATVALLTVYGTEYDGPSLPSTVALDSIDGPYTGSFGIATRIETPHDETDTVTAIGLVRGTNATLSVSEFAAVPLTESNLTLAVTNRSEETVTVRAQLRDNETGAPIQTSDRDGYLVVAGQRVNTTENGTVDVTVSSDRDAVSARYEPSFWWWDIPGYTGDTAIVSTGGSTFRYLDALFGGFVPIGALLLAGYILDRFTNWGFWPPWRGL
ncbi:hypothetical protein [Haloarcula nitratireducens]|uniref:Uncharacterized protein n=1 Tax=Haloarcula nitratireducens TaxID=2487749 RepID=A0AAW4PKK6_9EURY|nr:hypothetical protein [Halomicroarcula nitratireducens]MBX0297895.1 hypothetical protein [Halomicroarcula nitratireducens]